MLKGKLNQINRAKTNEKSNKTSDNLTFTQSLCRVIDRKNEIFSTHGTLNLDFLNNANDNNNVDKRKYDTKSFKKFEEEMQRKIHQLNK